MNLHTIAKDIAWDINCPADWHTVKDLCHEHTGGDLTDWKETWLARLVWKYMKPSLKIRFGFTEGYHA